MQLKDASVDGFDSALAASLGKFRVTLNENSLLLLSRLIDENYDDLDALLLLMPK